MRMSDKDSSQESASIDGRGAVFRSRKLNRKSQCQYGSECRRLNPRHLMNQEHPHLAKLLPEYLKPTFILDEHSRLEYGLRQSDEIVLLQLNVLKEAADKNAKEEEQKPQSKKKGQRRQRRDKSRSYSSSSSSDDEELVLSISMKDKLTTLEWLETYTCSYEDVGARSCGVCNIVTTGNESISLNTCDDVFHKKCIISILEASGGWYIKCPTCAIVHGFQIGTQPTKGASFSSTVSPISLKGFEECGHIEIAYIFKTGGIQGREHPNPGQKYTVCKDFPRKAYLPSNTKGRAILNMLEIAFDRRLTFRIGNSVTRNVKDTIIWNDIPHVTSMKEKFPDDYMLKVVKSLRAYGIVSKEPCIASLLKCVSMEDVSKTGNSAASLPESNHKEEDEMEISNDEYLVTFEDWMEKYTIKLIGSVKRSIICGLCKIAKSSSSLSNNPNFYCLCLCRHEFHFECIENLLEESGGLSVNCPRCNVIHGIQIGTQPLKTGIISVRFLKAYIEVTFMFKAGVQTQIHPHPGKLFIVSSDFPQKIYLPLSNAGKAILSMFKVAFYRRILFTIDSKNFLVWADIPRIMTMRDFPSHYIKDVCEWLQRKGITTKDPSIVSIMADNYIPNDSCSFASTTGKKKNTNESILNESQQLQVLPSFNREKHISKQIRSNPKKSFRFQERKFDKSNRNTTEKPVELSFSRKAFKRSIYDNYQQNFFGPSVFQEEKDMDRLILNKTEPRDNLMLDKKNSRLKSPTFFHGRSKMQTECRFGSTNKRVQNIAEVASLSHGISEVKKSKKILKKPWRSYLINKKFYQGYSGDNQMSLLNPFLNQVGNGGDISRDENQISMAFTDQGNNSDNQAETSCFFDKISDNRLFLHESSSVISRVTESKENHYNAEQVASIREDQICMAFSDQENNSDYQEVTPYFFDKISDNPLVSHKSSSVISNVTASKEIYDNAVQGALIRDQIPMAFKNQENNSDYQMMTPCFCKISDNTLFSHGSFSIISSVTASKENHNDTEQGVSPRVSFDAELSNLNCEDLNPVANSFSHDFIDHSEKDNEKLLSMCEATEVQSCQSKTNSSKCCEVQSNYFESESLYEANTVSFASKLEHDLLEYGGCSLTLMIPCTLFVSKRERIQQRLAENISKKILKCGVIKEMNDMDSFSVISSNHGLCNFCLDDIVSIVPVDINIGVGSRVRFTCKNNNRQADWVLIQEHSAVKKQLPEIMLAMSRNFEERFDKIGLKIGALETAICKIDMSAASAIFGV